MALCDGRCPAGRGDALPPAERQPADLGLVCAGFGGGFQRSWQCSAC